MINAYGTSGSSPGRKNVLASTLPDFSTPIMTSRDAACYNTPFTITALIKQADVSLRARSLNGKLYGDSVFADLIDAYRTSGSSPGHKNPFCVSGSSPTVGTFCLYRCTSVLRHSNEFKTLRHLVISTIRGSHHVRQIKTRQLKKVQLPPVSGSAVGWQGRYIWQWLAQGTGPSRAAEVKA